MVKQSYFTITGTTTQGLSTSGTNCNEEIFDIPKATEMKPHHQIV